MQLSSRKKLGCIRGITKNHEQTEKINASIFEEGNALTFKKDEITLI